MIMAKSGQKSFDNENNIEDNVLLQTGIEEKHKTAHKAAAGIKTKSDDLDVLAVDDLMKKYDQQEKVEKQNQEFVKVLKSDEKIRKFFLENYNPGTDNADDERYISFVFSKYSEQGWSEDGQPLDKQVLSKKTARKFANDIVQKWTNIDTEQSPKQVLAQSESFLDKGKRFDNAWKKFDNSPQQTGMIDLMEAHSFIKSIVPKVEPHPETTSAEQKAAEDLIAQTLF